MDIDGEPISDIDGVPLDEDHQHVQGAWSIDGAPLGAGSDNAGSRVDGLPLDEDHQDVQGAWSIDGAPIGADLDSAGSRNIAGEKLQVFSKGYKKKTPFQKHLEEEQARKKVQHWQLPQAEDETARVYQEFVASFSVEENASKNKAFVRGETIVPATDKAKAAGAATSGGFVVLPAPKVEKEAGKRPSLFDQPPISQPLSLEAQNEAELRKWDAQMAALCAPRKKDKEKKKRNLDLFVEELKKEQQQRDERARARMAMGLDPKDEATPAKGDLRGSFDTGDPDTTNLYVGNLSPQVNEEVLLREFGKFGPIQSVKVMWPRTEEERRRSRNCGFVSFESRKDAEVARNEMDGMELLGSMIRIGWGKAIKTATGPSVTGGAAVPFAYGPTPTQAAATPPPWQTADSGSNFSPAPATQASGFSAAPVSAAIVPTPSTGSRFSPAPAQSAPPPPAVPLGPPSVTSPSRAAAPPPTAGFGYGALPPQITVIRPVDPDVQRLIDRLAKFVVQEGYAFEHHLMQREGSNPKYAFVVTTGSPENIYYRWRLWAYAQGDSDTHWRAQSFQIYVGGPFWIPPPLPDRDRDRRSRSPSPRRERSHRDRERRSRSGSPRRERDRSHRDDRDRHRDRRDRDRDRSPREKSPKDKSPIEKDRDRDHRDKDKDKDKDKERSKGRGRDREKCLPSDERDDFEDMLRSITVEREHIMEAMVFALDHAEFSKEIVQVTAEALSLKETPLPTKLARLYLVSDILHNSSVPVQNASSYRSGFESKLPAIFDSLNETYRSIAGRIKAEAFKEKVLYVLHVWEAWSLYPYTYLHGLEATFLRKRDQEQPKPEPEPEQDGTADANQTESDGAVPATSPSPSASSRAGSVDLRALPQPHLERLCKTHGLVSTGTREQLVQRLLPFMDSMRKQEDSASDTDSAPRPAPRSHVTSSVPHLEGMMDYTSDKDGNSSDDDARRSASSGTPAPKPAVSANDPLSKSKWNAADDTSEGEGRLPRGSAQAVAVTPSGALSKWSRATEDIFDDDDNGNQTPGAQAQGGGGGDSFSNGSTVAGQPGPGAGSGPLGPAMGHPGPSGQGARGDDEDRRKLLRQVELEVMQHADKLETSGLSRPAIEQQCELFRQARLAHYEAKEKQQKDREREKERKEREREKEKEREKDKDSVSSKRRASKRRSRSSTSSSSEASEGSSEESGSDVGKKDKESKKKKRRRKEQEEKEKKGRERQGSSKGDREKEKKEKEKDRKASRDKDKDREKDKDRKKKDKERHSRDKRSRSRSRSRS